MEGSTYYLLAIAIHSPEWTKKEMKRIIKEFSKDNLHKIINQKKIL